MQMITRESQSSSFIGLLLMSCTIFGCIAMPLKPVGTRSAAANNLSAAAAAAVTRAPDHSDRMMDRWWCVQKCEITNSSAKPVSDDKVANYFTIHKTNVIKTISDAIKIYKKNNPEKYKIKAVDSVILYMNRQLPSAAQLKDERVPRLKNFTWSVAELVRLIREDDECLFYGNPDHRRRFNETAIKLEVHLHELNCILIGVQQSQDAAACRAGLPHKLLAPMKFQPHNCSQASKKNESVIRNITRTFNLLKGIARLFKKHSMSIIEFRTKTNSQVPGRPAAR